MSRNEGALILGAALLLGTGLFTAFPAVAVAMPMAKAEVATSVTSSASDPVAAEFFHVTWSVSPARNGRSRITGYVYNDWWEPAENVVLRINKLDASGQVTAAEGRPLVETITPHDRVYFDTQVPHASSYDVGVSGFDFIQGP